jgi:flagellar basal body-associated protein FliL
MAAEKGQKDTASGGSLIVPIVLLLCLGAGAGFGYGWLFGGANKSVDVHAGTVKDGAVGAAAERASPSDNNGRFQADWRNEQLVPIQPLVVRMGGSKGKWIRLEGAVAFSRESKQDRAAIVAQLGQDLMLFLGSTELQQIASPTGLEFLRDDMNDIVQSRTHGQANRFIVKSLVVE